MRGLDTSRAGYVTDVLVVKTTAAVARATWPCCTFSFSPIARAEARPLPVGTPPDTSYLGVGIRPKGGSSDEA
jgi:hypothetical protein